MIHTLETADHTVETVKWTAEFIGAAVGIVGTILLGIVGFFGWQTYKETQAVNEEAKKRLAEVLTIESRATAAALTLETSVDEAVKTVQRSVGKGAGRESDFCFKDVASRSKETAHGVCGLPFNRLRRRAGREPRHSKI